MLILKTFCFYNGTEQINNILVLLGNGVLTVEKRYKYGMGKGKVEPCHVEWIGSMSVNSFFQNGVFPVCWKSLETVIPSSKEHM